MKSTCSHLEKALAQHPKIQSQGCEECLKAGDTWVHLRQCTECGHMGCCDSSKNKHATRHFHTTGHPVIRSNEPGETWLWCYTDELTIDPESEDFNLRSTG